MYARNTLYTCFIRHHLNGVTGSPEAGNLSLRECAEARFDLGAPRIPITGRRNLWVFTGFRSKCDLRFGAKLLLASILIRQPTSEMPAQADFQNQSARRRLSLFISAYAESSAFDGVSGSLQGSYRNVLLLVASVTMDMSATDSCRRRNGIA